MAGDRTGLLILRVTADPRFADTLRIYLRMTSDVVRGFESSREAHDIDDAVDVVRVWLTDQEARGSHSS